MDDRKFTRIDLLKALAVAPFAVAAVASVATEADAKGTKAAFKYVEHPVKNQEVFGLQPVHCKREGSREGTRRMQGRRGLDQPERLVRRLRTESH